MGYKHRNYREDGTFWVSVFADDESRTVTTYTEAGGVLTTRDYDEVENAAADARMSASARITDLETRVKAIEDRLDPAPPDPTEPAGVKTLAEWGGRWPDQNLLIDGGVVYRNVSGTVLTWAPSDFPGEPSQWGHLFVVALAPDEPVDPVDPTGAEPWDKDTRYEIGDECTKDGRLYRCKVAHGAEYAGTWSPPIGSVWEDIGPAA